MWKKAQAIQKQNTVPHVLSRGGYEYLENKLMEENKKKKVETASQSRSTDIAIDPSSPSDDTWSERWPAAKEIPDKIVSDFQLLIVIIYVYSVIE